MRNPTVGGRCLSLGERRPPLFCRGSAYIHGLFILFVENVLFGARKFVGVNEFWGKWEVSLTNGRICDKMMLSNYPYARIAPGEG